MSIDLTELRTRLLDIQAGTLFADVALDQLAGLYLETASLIDALRSIQGEIKGEIGAIFVETGRRRPRPARPA